MQRPSSLVGCFWISARAPFRRHSGRCQPPWAFFFRIWKEVGLFSFSIFNARHSLAIVLFYLGSAQGYTIQTRIWGLSSPPCYGPCRLSPSWTLTGAPLLHPGKNTLTMALLCKAMLSGITYWHLLMSFISEVQSHSNAEYILDSQKHEIY